jgi:hypothetical protein
VAEAGQDSESVAQVFVDRLGLGGRFYYDYVGHLRPKYLSDKRKHVLF